MNTILIKSIKPAYITDSKGINTSFSKT